MQLSKRLQAVANLVTPGKRLADIGTDHGYVPIWLYEQGRIPFALAMDLREGPLQRAAEHIRMHGLDEKIKTRLSDGLEKLLPGETDSIVIAGMGGMLVVKILTQGQAVLDSIQELILQPQSDLDAVREYLHRTGFVIVQEEMVFEEGKYYPMMKAVHGENTDDRKIWFLYGRLLLENRHPVLESYLQKEYDSCCKLLEKLSKTATEVSSRRCEELLEKKHLIEEALAFYREDT